MKYRPEVDGLRAIAIIPVILFHAGFQMASGGFAGVDVFFVISGYLITSIILAEKEAGRFTIINFYERRARRILPALFFVMLLCIPMAWLLLAPQEMKDFSQSVTAVALFSSNILFWKESGYFGMAAEMKPLLHTWSLAVEEQYYLLFPLFIMAAWRLGRKWMLISLACIAIFSMILAQWGSISEPTPTYYLLPTRAWELLIGVFVAFYLSDIQEDELSASNNKTMLRQLASAAGFLLILYSFIFFSKSTPFPGLYALLPTIGTAFIILFADEYTYIGKLLRHKYLVGMGLISYSAYLWHQPLIAFAKHYNSAHTTGLVYGACIAAPALAYFSWKYLEAPFRNKNTTSRKLVFTFSLIGILFFAAVGFAGHHEDGFMELRYGKAASNLFRSAEFSPKRRACNASSENYIKPANACEYFGSNVTMAVMGDSHAVELAYAFAEKLEPYNIGVKHLSFSACEPNYGRADLTTPCANWTNESMEYLINDRNINTVVVSYRIHMYLFGNHEDVYPEMPNEVNGQERELVWRSYVGMLESLKKAGKDVILVLQAPELPMLVENLIADSGEHPSKIAGVDRSWWQKRTRYVANRLSEIPTGVKIIDPADIFCNKNSCFVSNSNFAYYFDDDHLSVVGAEYVAEKVLTDTFTNRFLIASYTRHSSNKHIHD